MAFLQSQPPREPFLHAPATVLWLIAALVLAHIAMGIVPTALSDEILTQYALIPARYIHGVSSSGALFALAVPFASYMFLHGDFVHLGVNCLWLLAFGPIVARRFGAILFYVFFAVCGAAGAATCLAMDWGSSDVFIGASGAISGLMGAAIRMYPLPGLRLARSLAPIFSRPILLFSGIWLAVNFVFGLTGFREGGEIQQIAWQAHAGGYLVGLTLAGVFDALHHRWPTKKPDAG